MLRKCLTFNLPPSRNSRSAEMRQAPVFEPDQQQEEAAGRLVFLLPVRLLVSLCRMFHHCCKHSYQMAVCLLVNEWLAHLTFLRSPKPRPRAPAHSQRLIILDR